MKTNHPAPILEEPTPIVSPWPVVVEHIMAGDASSAGLIQVSSIAIQDLQANWTL